MQQDERDAKIIAMLLHRCGGIVTLVRGDFQAVEGKKTMVVGRIGNTVTLELVDE